MFSMTGEVGFLHKAGIACWDGNCTQIEVENREMLCIQETGGKG